MCAFRRVSRTRVVLIAAAAVGTSAGLARADNIVLANESIEVQHRSSTGAYSTSQAQPWSGMRIGFQSGFGGPDSGNGLGGIDAVMFFQLPTIPAGKTISSAGLTFSELKEASTGTLGTIPNFNVDLYALGFDKNSPPNNDGAGSGFGTGGVTSATVAPAYFYVGPNQTSPTTITGVNPSNAPMAKIQEDVLVPADWTAANAAADNQVVHTTSAAGNAALLNYVSGLYGNANFTAGHDYLVLRMNPDISPTSTATKRYQIPFAQTATFNDGVHTPTSTTATPPTLSVTFALPGDANSDGIVDQLDLNIINGNWQAATHTWGSGDLNNDGIVDQLDLNIVNANWQLASPTGPSGVGTAALASVPEPATVTLLLAAGATAMVSRRRRR